jgi:transcription initiation factor TFIIIB Brf1 subunit/transcription initiation factor TFIIB
VKKMAYIKTITKNWEESQEQKDLNCCRSPNIILSNGFNVCTNCGITFSKIISSRHPRRFFIDGTLNNSSTEPVRSLFGPRTIFRGNIDGKGNFLSPGALRLFKRISKINWSSINGFEKNLWYAEPKLNQVKTLLNLPDYIMEYTLKIYIPAAKLKLTLGRSIDGILAVSLYFALKVHRIPRLIEEILAAFQISMNKFLYCYKAMYNELLPRLNLTIHTFTPKDYINQFYEKLNLSIDCRSKALELFKKSETKGVQYDGKDPKGIAAASLYLSSKLNDEFRTQKQICKIANVSEITLRMRLKEISSVI